MRAALALALLLVACAARAPISAPSTARVAITFDDLGATTETSDPARSERILGELHEAQAPVAVFANCAALDGATLRMWEDAGATLGNHTATHLSIDAADEARWTNDVERCQQTLSSAARGPVRYFRFPYLRYGSTIERRDVAASRLRGLGLSIAHVTAATSEWLLAEYYDVAMRAGDHALAEEIAAAYVEHMRETLRVAQHMAIEKVGRDVAQITLLHVNRLAADHLGDVLRALRIDGWQFVTLEDALADPVYALDDAYAGGCGCSWLARIEPALRREDPYVFGDDEDRIRARFEARIAPLRE